MSARRKRSVEFAASASRPDSYWLSNITADTSDERQQIEQRHR